MLRGYVFNSENKAIPSVNVRDFSTGLGAITNAAGQYELRLEEGYHKIVFSSIGFEDQEVEIVMDQDKVHNVWLQDAPQEIETITVRAKKKDYSYEVIRQVIENKHKYEAENQYKSLRHHIYIKSVEDVKRIIKPDKNSEEEKDQETRLESVFQTKDSIPKLHLFEAEIVMHYQAPNSFKEEKKAAKKLASQYTLFYTSTTDGDFDFYKNLMVIRRLGDNTYVSPFSPTTFLSYKFKLLGSYFENGQKIYKIQIKPRKHGNALLKGTIEVYDKLWALKSVELEFPSSSLILYNEFTMRQEYAFVDSIHVVKNQEFYWKLKDNKQVLDGYCTAEHKNFLFDTTYHKRYFGAELGFTAMDAYEKDTSYWNKIRPKPLSIKEQAFVMYQDSLKRVRNSKEYLDSIDSVYNKITIQKLLLRGFGHINRSKKQIWDFDPALNLLDPLAIGGWRVKYRFSYFKRFENRKSIYISPFLNYGFRNQDVKGSLYISHLYDPMKISRVSVSIGRYFGFVNNFATIGDIFRRSNFYDQSYLNIGHRTELFNGFYLGTALNYVDRRDLGNFQFAPIGDSLYANNDPVTFPRNTNFGASIYISYTPHQLYRREPKQKIVLGSKYPTITLSYDQSFPKVLNSNNKYSKGSLAVDQRFNIGTIGTSEYRVSASRFFDTTQLSIMDYSYQRGGDPYWFSPAMYTYQLIDSTFPTFNWTFESHYVHQFNGFLIGRIPGFKHARIRSMAGGGFLYVPERKYQYSELFFGLNRIFKIGKERFRIGTYYVISQSNTQGFRSGIKFSFEPYNINNNSWSF